MEGRDEVSTLIVVVLGAVGARAGERGERAIDVGGPRQQALLAALAQRSGSTVSVDSLADAVWEGDPPASVHRTFRTYVARLRKSLSVVDGIERQEVIRTDPGGYRLDADTVDLDADLFEALVARAGDRLQLGETVAAVELLDEALSMWTGPAYGRFNDAHWARPEARRLEELRTVARELRVQALLDAGRVDRAISEGDALAAEHLHRESVVRLGVLGRYRSGRHAEALSLLRSFRDRLAEQTGLDPSSRLDELERMVLEQDPRLDRPAGGRRLRGYVLHEVLATTPLGVVHRAEQPSIGREVAVTVVAAVSADDADVVRLFETRAQEVAAVEHPNVVPLYDYWREPGGAFLVTRLPGGGTLSQRMARGPLDGTTARRMLRQIVEAVAAAHAQGVVHGALSSDAIVLDDDGNAHLWAFALDSSATGVRDDLHALADLVEVVDGRSEGLAAVAALDVPVAELVRAARTDADPRITSVVGLLDALMTSSAVGPHDGGSPWSAAPMVVAPGPNPYRGLAAFRETDADVFFGRDELARTIVARLRRQPFLAVFGASGSGKSSVVRAGALPALRREGAFVTTMVPGPAPVAELGVALSRIAAVALDDVEDALLATDRGLAGVLADVLPTSEGEAVLVVDQFEELFTLTPADERNAFLGVLRDALAHPQRPVRVVVTARADFLGQILDDPIAGELVTDRIVVTKPLTADELHEIVVGPAEVAGVAVEPELATAIVADAVRASGSLPMVQFALTEVYEAAVDGTMTLDSYRRLGGIEGVLGQRAEEVYTGLDDEGRAATRRLFQRLVLPNDDGPPTRRRALRAELLTVPDSAVEAFGAARLLRFDHDEESREPTVEVTHEALFREWPRLTAWIEAGIDDLRVLGHLTTSAAEWDAEGRDDAELYRGSRLDTALAFADEHDGELTDQEEDFLEHARLRRIAERDREARRLRRLRQLTGGLAVGLMIALAAGGVALSSRQDAVEATADAVDAREQEIAARQAQEEVAARAQADALAFSSTATLDDDLDLAMLLAAEAFAAQDSTTTQAALLEALTYEPRVVSVRAEPPGTCGATSRDGDTTVVVAQSETATGTRTASIYTAGLELVRSFVMPDGAGCLIPDATGRWGVTHGDTLSLGVVDLASGEELTPISKRLDAGPVALSVSPSGDEVLLVDEEGGVHALPLPSLDVVETLAHQLPDGGRWAWHSENGTHRVLPGDGVVVFVGPQRQFALAVEGEPLAGTVVERLGLAVAVGSTEVAVAPLDEPTESRSIELEGTVEGPLEPAVLPEEPLLAVTTSAGLEFVDLVGGTTVGEPLDLGKWFPFPAPRDDGRFVLGDQDYNFVIEPNRSSAIASMVTTGPPATPETFLAAARDGSSYLAIGGGQSTLRVTATGEQVPIDIGHEGSRAVGVGLLGEGAWVRIDVRDKTFQRWRGAELELETDLADVLPDELLMNVALLDTDDRHVLAILMSPPEPGVDDPGYALTVDHATGKVVGLFDPAEEVRGPRTLGRLVGSDLVLTYHEVGLVGLWTRDGRPAPGHLRLEAALFGGAATEDGSLVAVPAGNGSIHLLDGAGEVVGVLTGTSGVAYDLAFLDDGRLVSRHHDGTTRLWDVAERRLVGTVFRGTESRGIPSWPVTVDDETGDLLQPTGAGLLRIDLAPDSWLDAVCATVTRELRQEEAAAVTPGWRLRRPCRGSDR